MSSSRARHEKLLAQRKSEVHSLEARTRVVSTARLVVFLAAIALSAFVVWAHLPHVVWLAVFALLFVFVGLVVLHARIHAALEKKQAAERFHEQALARMAGKWRTQPSRGERWASETHPYSSNLDIFGQASLFQLMDVTATRFGEEVLAKWLSGEQRPASPAKSSDAFEGIRARQDAVRDLAPRLPLREELAVLGSLLDETKPNPRPFVMWAGQHGAERSLPSWTLIPAVVLPLASVGVLVASSFGLVPRLTFLLPFGLALATLAALRPKTSTILDAASSKESALSRYGSMLALLENESFEAEALKALKARLQQNGTSATKEMASLSRIVSFLDARNNEVFRFFIGPIFMWDLWCARALDAWRLRAGRAAFGWFRALAEWEALASLAAFAFEHPDSVFPKFTEEPTFEVEGLGHPQSKIESASATTYPSPAPRTRSS